MNLAGQVALVTGRRRSRPRRALAVAGDATARDDVTRVVSTAESQLGPIDIPMNSAGVVGPLGERRDAPIERCQDGEEELVYHAEEIRRNDLHTVTLRT